MTTEDKLEEMEETIKEVNHKLDEVLSCLKGNDMGSEGLVKDVHILKKELQDIKDSRITEKTEAKIYKDAAKWLLGTVIVLVIAYLFNQTFTPKP